VDESSPTELEAADSEDATVIESASLDAPANAERRAVSPPKDEDAATSPDPGAVAQKSGLTKLGEMMLAPFTEFGMLCSLFYESMRWAVRPPFRFRLYLASLDFIGVGSIFIVGLTGLFTGMVLGLQLVDSLRDFSAESQAGAIVGLGLSREIAPVFTALMVSSRAGSAITTELGSMRVTQQIDALEVLAVNPVQYLVVPRLIAGFIMVPVLTVFFDIVGIFGAWAVGTGMMGVDGGIFLARMQWMVDWPDVLQGMVKGAVFGVVLTLVACRQGFFASGGAAGVGQATNRSVVHNAIVILAVDYLITVLWLGGSGVP
jgi:phospholipid/cholesterol/gamma-HCH transport system permease protein